MRHPLAILGLGVGALWGSLAYRFGKAAVTGKVTSHSPYRNAKKPNKTSA
jgi:hypothetical protein